MKRLILSGISALLLATAHVPAVNAQPLAINSATLNSTTSNHLKPFNLVTLAYRGYFKQQGIPSYSALITAHNAGRISAEDIVKSAVAANRLSPQVLSDQRYLNAVSTQLDALRSSR